MTLRQIFEQYFRRDEDGDDVKTKAGTNGAADDSRGAVREEGARGIPGLGLSQYECWKPVEGEKDDESVVPLPTVLARYYAMGFELCRRGMLGQVRRGDFEAGKIFLDGQWRQWELKNNVKRKDIRAEFDRETELWRQRVQAVGSEE